MTIPQRKAHLKRLIDSVRDPAILDRVARVLEKPTTKPARQSALVKRVLKSEEDYKAGRFQTLEEFEKGMDQFMGSLDDKKPTKSKRRK